MCREVIEIVLDVVISPATSMAIGVLVGFVAGVGATYHALRKLAIRKGLWEQLNKKEEKKE